MKTALVPVLGTMATLFAAVVLRTADLDTSGRAGAAAELCRPTDGTVSRRPQETQEDPCRHGLEER